MSPALLVLVHGAAALSLSGRHPLAATSAGVQLHRLSSPRALDASVQPAVGSSEDELEWMEDGGGEDTQLSLIHI